MFLMTFDGSFIPVMRRSKKINAPSNVWALKKLAMVVEIVLFPEPARPYNQKILSESGADPENTHFPISFKNVSASPFMARETEATVHVSGGRAPLTSALLLEIMQVNGCSARSLRRTEQEALAHSQLTWTLV